MTVFHKSVKVRNLDPTAYQPPIGLDVIWSKQDNVDKQNNERWATFVGSDKLTKINEIKGKHEINETLSKLKVIQDSVRNWTTYRNLPQEWRKIVWQNGKVVDKG